MLKKLFHQKLIAVLGNERSYFLISPGIRFLVHHFSSNYSSVPGFVFLQVFGFLCLPNELPWLCLVLDGQLLFKAIS